MGTTTISLRDEAYERLKAAKREDESFSDVVLRLTTAPRTEEEIAAVAGGLGTDTAAAVAESAAEVRSDLEMESGTE